MNTKADQIETFFLMCTMTLPFPSIFVFTYIISLCIYTHIFLPSVLGISRFSPQKVQSLPDCTKGQCSKQISADLDEFSPIWLEFVNEDYAFNYRFVSNCSFRSTKEFFVPLVCI